MVGTLGLLGPLLADLGRLLLVTPVFAAMLSFHATAARDTFALARENVLPAVLARTGVGTGAGRDAPSGDRCCSQASPHSWWPSSPSPTPTRWRCCSPGWRHWQRWR